MPNTNNRVSELAGILLSGISISLLVVSLRFWIRFRILRVTGPDDWFLLASFVATAVAFSLFGTACVYGLGKHAAALGPDEVINAMKYMWIAFFFTPFAEVTGKISIALMLRRITTKKTWKRFFVAIIVLNVIINVVMTITLLTTCRPIRLLWDPSAQGHCNLKPRTVTVYLQGPFLAMTDLVLAISPVILLWKVQITHKSKCLLCGLLSLGLFTAAAGFARIKYTYETHDEGTKIDPTWGLIDFLIWKCVEIALSVIVGCLPTLRPLFDRNLWGRGSTAQYRVNSYCGA